jgi:hypothetical protein
VKSNGANKNLQEKVTTAVMTIEGKGRVIVLSF